MTDAIRELFELLTKKEKSGSDYTGTVTRVDGKTAYVKFDGSDITDTPVALSIGAKAGDSVRVRVADGRAWIVGNDDAPPNDSSEVGYELALTNALIRQLTTEQINGENGWINLLLGTFNYGNKLVWNGKELTLNGKVIATSGKIGGFTIEDDALVNEEYIEISPYTSAYSGGRIKVSDSYGRYVNIAPHEIRLSNADKTVQSYIEPGSAHITGNVYAGSSRTNYNFIENGVALSNKYAPKSGSDIRLKENVDECEVNSALEVIDRIKLHSFDWRKDGKHQQIGFVADELEEIDEHLADGGGYDADGEMIVKSVDTFYLQGYEIKAIQELHAEVRSLKAEIAELKEIIAVLMEGKK